VDTREQTAQRLLAASVRHWYDPEREIDWDAPLDPDAFWLAPERSSLYGTTLWDGLTRAQRIELTKHEVASAASAGVWFESMLMQMLVREYYDQDPTSEHAQYALTEIADECRHSVMFGRLLARLGIPAYPASPFDHALGRWLKATASGPHMYAAILLAEETLDSFQREIMADESLQPLIRMVSRIHVVEEARHVKYARQELARQVSTAGPVRMAYSRLVLGRVAMSISDRLVRPGIYAAVGLDPRSGRAAALANPKFRETMRWSASKATAYLRELGLIGGPGLALWRRSALL
jgi:hypothetical protein